MNLQMRRPPPSAEQYARDGEAIRALRRLISDRIERDIALLDAIDIDPDLEGAKGVHLVDTLGDGEPSGLCAARAA